MKTSFVRKSTTASIVFAALLTIGLAGCKGDVGAAKLKAVHSGMPRDSVIQIMGEGPLTAVRANNGRLEHGFRKQAYFINGRVIEILWFRVEPGDVSEIVQKNVETPILVVGDTAAGWGWKYYTAQAPKLGLPNALAPADSLKVAQDYYRADSIYRAYVADSVAKKNAADSAAAAKLKPPVPPVKKP